MRIDGKYCLRPNAASGSFARKLDTALGITLDDPSIYRFATVGQDNRERSRSAMELSAKLPHERLVSEFKSDPTMFRSWVEKRTSSEWANGRA